jgi:hypothetical protein
MEMLDRGGEYGVGSGCLCPYHIRATAAVVDNPRLLGRRRSGVRTRGVAPVGSASVSAAAECAVVGASPCFLPAHVRHKDELALLFRVLHRVATQAMRLAPGPRLGPAARRGSVAARSSGRGTVLMTSVLPVTVCSPVGAAGTRNALPLAAVALSGRGLPCAVTDRRAVVTRSSSGSAASVPVAGVGDRRVGCVAHVAEAQKSTSGVVDVHSAARTCMGGVLLHRSRVRTRLSVARELASCAA